ncbi:MAG: TonB C-terminal domain-containing protein [Thiovulaceae bacterium]|nr:TonB C-terminal domain-containing protein [Sulfurimonadaceae bacterium]
MLFRDTNLKSYAFDKKDFMSVSLDMVVSKPKKNANSDMQIEDITVPEQVKENINIDDLFSDVSTQKITREKKKVKKIDSKRYNEIAKKVKTSKVKEVESISKKIKSIESKEIIKDVQTNSSDSSADEVNEYLAKIQATIYNHFNPPQNTQGKSAEVVIELSSIGKMLDFRVLSYSDNESFNDELNKIKKRLQSVIFPKNPNNENYRLTTIIISKE